MQELERVVFEQWKADRQRCRTDLLYLAKDWLHYKDIEEKVHAPLAEMLQKFPGGEDWMDEHGNLHYSPYKTIWELTGPRNILILYPRGHLKTTVITISGVIQWIINFPDIRVLLSTATGDQVKKLITEITAQFRYNPEFRWLFPEFCPPAKAVNDWGTQEGFTVPCRVRKAMKEPTLSTCSVGKVIAGGHYEVLLTSDIVDKENVKTASQIIDVKDHFRYMNPLMERGPIAPHHGWQIVEGTPYDFSDLYMEIIDRNSKGNTDWNILVKGAEIDTEKKTTLWPTRFPWEELQCIKRGMTDYQYCCFGAGTKVLMSDFSEKNIEDVRVGDEVVGWEYGNGKRIRLKRSVVQATHTERSDAQEVTTSHGVKFVCTPDHKFWTGRMGKQKMPYGVYERQSYAPLQMGTKVFAVYDLIPFGDQRTWDWLGGIVDGEGSCPATHITISQSPEHNPEVCEEIEAALRQVGVDYSIYEREPRPGHKAANLYVLNGGHNTKIRLLHNAKMVKRERIIKSLWRSPGRPAWDKHRVTSIRPVGVIPVYNIQTETGNYIANSYMTKNCQYLCKPINPSGGLATPDQIKFISRATIKELLPSLRKHVTVDLHGMEAKDTCDYTVITLAGFDRDGRCYILDIKRGHFTPFQVIEIIFALHATFQIFDFKIEKDAHARVLLPFLVREMTKRGKFPNIIAIPRSNQTSKKNRIWGLQPWFQAGVIRFADDIDCRIDLITEVTSFSNTSREHDDILDTLADQMQNREGGVTGDVIPLPSPNYGIPREPPPDAFLGFDPLTKDALWQRDQWRSTSYHETGI